MVFEMPESYFDVIFKHSRQLKDMNLNRRLRRSPIDYQFQLQYI